MSESVQTNRHCGSKGVNITNYLQMNVSVDSEKWEFIQFPPDFPLRVNIGG